jgi:hypothetical protein
MEAVLGVLAASPNVVNIALGEHDPPYFDLRLQSENGPLSGCAISVG